MTRWLGWLAALALGVAPAAARVPLSALGTFQLGSSAGIQCSAQSRPNDAVATGMFDRAYALSCRDATAAPGKLYVLTAAAGDPAARLAAARGRIARCDSAHPVDLPDAPGATETLCRLDTAAIPYAVYAVARGGRLYVAEGLAGYDDALRLALRSLVADRVVTGTIGATVTAAVGTPPPSPARRPAASIRRSRSAKPTGATTGAATPSRPSSSRCCRRTTSPGGSAVSSCSAQRSSSRTSARSPRPRRCSPASRPTTCATPSSCGCRATSTRSTSSTSAAPEDALTELDRRVTPAAAERRRRGPGDRRAGGGTAQPQRDDRDGQRRGADGRGASPGSRRAGAPVARRGGCGLAGDPAAARTALRAALAAFDDIGRREIASVARLKSAAYADLAGLAEASGDLADAEIQLRAAETAVAAEYPDSLATLSVEARLAALLARRGKIEPALTLYRTVVARAAASGTVGPGLLGGLAPYFALLAHESVARPALAADFFTASQLLLRPGVAQTQAVLARELSGGDDEAARLFRQSTALTRDVDRTRIEIDRLAARAAPTVDDATRLTALRARLVQLEIDQTATTSALGKYPRYKAIATTGLTLAELQAALKPGEAYLKLTAPGTRPVWHADHAGGGAPVRGRTERRGDRAQGQPPAPEHRRHRQWRAEHQAVRRRARL